MRLVQAFLAWGLCVVLALGATGFSAWAAAGPPAAPAPVWTVLASAEALTMAQPCQVVAIPLHIIHYLKAGEGKYRLDHEGYGANGKVCLGAGPPFAPECAPICDACPNVVYFPAWSASLYHNLYLEVHAEAPPFCQGVPAGISDWELSIGP